MHHNISGKNKPMEVSSLSLDGTSVDRRDVAKVRTHETKESDTTDDSSNAGLSAFEIDGVEVIDIYPIEEEDSDGLNGNGLSAEPKSFIKDMKKEKLHSFKAETKRRSSIVAKSAQIKKKLSQGHLFGKKVKKKDKRKTNKSSEETRLFEQISTMASSAVSEHPPQPVKKNVAPEVEPVVPSSQPVLSPTDKAVLNESEAAGDADEKSFCNEQNVKLDETMSNEVPLVESGVLQVSDDEASVEPSISMDEVKKSNAEDSKDDPVDFESMMEEIEDQKEEASLEEKTQFIARATSPFESIETIPFTEEGGRARIGSNDNEDLVVVKQSSEKEKEVTQFKPEKKRLNRLSVFVKSGNKKMLTTCANTTNDDSVEIAEEESLEIREEKTSVGSSRTDSIPPVSLMDEDDSIVSENEAKKRGAKPMNHIICGRLDIATCTGERRASKMADRLLEAVCTTCGNQECGINGDSDDVLPFDDGDTLRELLFDDDTFPTDDDDRTDGDTLETSEDTIDEVNRALFILKRHANRLGVTESQLLEKIYDEQKKREDARKTDPEAKEFYGKV
jgi:hypothetical protein